LIPRIEGIAHTLADQVEGADREEDGEAGQEHEHPRVGIEHVLEAVRHQEPPRGGRLRSAETEEAERAFEEDGRPHSERRRHQRRRKAIGQHVHQQRAQPRAAQCAARLDVGHLPDAQRLGAHEPRSVRPARERDDRHGAEERGALEHALRGQEQEQQREAQQHLGGARDGHVDDAAQVPGEHSQKEADRHLDQGRHDAHAERGAGAVQQAGKNVAASAVGAERMFRARRLRQRPFQIGERWNGVGPVANGRPQRPVAGAKVARNEAAQRPVLDQVGKEVEGALLPQHDRPVARDEIREQGQQEEAERKAQPEQVPAPEREAPPRAAPHAGLPRSEMRGSTAA